MDRGLAAFSERSLRFFRHLSDHARSAHFPSFCSSVPLSPVNIQIQLSWIPQWFFRTITSFPQLIRFLWGWLSELLGCRVTSVPSHGCTLGIADHLSMKLDRPFLHERWPFRRQTDVVCDACERLRTLGRIVFTWSSTYPTSEGLSS